MRLRLSLRGQIPASTARSHIGLSNNRCWSSSSWRVSAALATSTQLPTSSRCSPTSVRDDNVFYLFFSETTRRTHRLCKPAPLPPFPPGDDLDPPLWNPSLWKIFPNKLSLSHTHRRHSESGDSAFRTSHYAGGPHGKRARAQLESGIPAFRLYS